MEQLSPLLLRIISESVTDAIHIRDRDGRLIFANASALSLFGRELQAATGLRNHDLYPDQAVATIVETSHQAVLSNGQSQSADFAVQTISGLRNYRCRTESWIGTQGEVLGTVSIATELASPAESISMAQEAQLAALVETRTAEVRELIGHLQTVREEEKRAIARELHDDLGSSLTALNMHLAMLFQQIPADANITHRITQIKGLLNAVTTTTRRLQNGLRPDKLDIFGLKIAINEQAQDFENFTGIRCTTSLPDEDIKYSTQVEISLYRIVQEALNNISKHAKASLVDIILDDDGEAIYLTIRDNGIGISATTPAKKTAHGLLSIRERAAYFGGTAEIDSQPGAGTRIRIMLPRSAKTIGHHAEETLKHTA